MMSELESHLKELGFIPTEGGAKPSVVSKLLSRLPAEVPKEYSDFLVQYAGGYFEEDVVVRCQVAPPQAVRGKCVFGMFLRVKGEGYTALAPNWNRGDSLGLVESGIVHIADGAGGNMFCLRLKTTDVVFWDHESTETYVVASSFHDFIMRLEGGGL